MRVLQQTHYVTRQLIAWWKLQVPPIINFLARHPVVSKYDLSSVRVIFSGAAPLDAETQAMVEKRLPNVRSCQGYGMTELSPVSHIPHPKKVIPGSIGMTVPNCECKIIDVSIAFEAIYAYI
jgi:long-subunit acyl-CoA synthetase (AMP-forming)